MTDSGKKLLFVGLAAAAIYMLYGGTTGDWGLCVMNLSSSWPSTWLESGACYVPTMNDLEAQYGLPANFLCAIAYQESRFNPGAVNASSGATGMFQLMPAYYPNAGQSWQTDAATAAGALAGYYNEFGNWQDAVAAYDWGPGNLTKTNPTQLSQLPTETQNYVNAIVSAVPVSGPF